METTDIVKTWRTWADSEEAKNKWIFSNFWDSEFTQYGPEGMIAPKSFSKWAKFIRQMEVRKDDVWVISFPKSGTTWTQEMVWLLANDLNFEEAKTEYLEDRFPLIEVDSMYCIPTKWNGTTDENKPPTTMESISDAPRTKPRFIKSHLPLSLLPKQLLEVHPKIVYIARNPKSVCVSYFHHCCLLHGYLGTMDDFAEAMISDNTVYSPFWPHVKRYYELHQNNHPNFLFLTFEDMKKDLKSVILKTAKFLDGKDLDSKDLEKLEKHLSFEEMKKNPRVNREWLCRAAFMGHNIPPRTAFIRKGQVDSWRHEMSPQWIQRFDDWIEKNKIPGLFDD